MIEREFVGCGLLFVCAGGFGVSWLVVARWITSRERGMQIWDKPKMSAEGERQATGLTGGTPGQEPGGGDPRRMPQHQARSLNKRDRN